MRDKREESSLFLNATGRKDLGKSGSSCGLGTFGNLDDPVPGKLDQNRVDWLQFWFNHYRMRFFVGADVSVVERMDRDQILERQWNRLRELLARAESNLFWNKKWGAAGVGPRELRSLDDLRLLPFTTKQELAADQLAHPPYGTFQGKSGLAFTRMHQTSGTTGAPLRWLDTAESWAWMLSCWEQNYRMVEIRPDDRFCFPFSFGPFLGFWAAFEGAQKQGCFSLAAGGISSSARLKLIMENRITVVCCTPTYAMRLLDTAKAEGIDLAGSSVRMLIVAGEPGGSLPTARKRIERGWGARVIDHWGMTELGPLANEVVDDPGNLYLLETECVGEIVDPETGEPTPAGEVGELVVTNLGRLDSPLIRYRTGDLVRGEYPPDAAGYHLLRLRGGILGRADEMVTIRGNNLFPAALEEVLRGFDEIEEFRIELSEERAMNHLRILVEPRKNAVVADLPQRIVEDVRDRWNFQAAVELVAEGTLPRFEMKGRRFVRIRNPSE